MAVTEISIGSVRFDGNPVTVSAPTLATVQVIERQLTWGEVSAYTWGELQSKAW